MLTSQLHQPPRSTGGGAPPGSDCIFELTPDSLHDLVSPMNQAGSLADLILEKYRGTLDAEAEVLFDLLQTAVHRLQNLLSGLANFVQVAGSPGAFRHCEGNAVLASALTMIQQTMVSNDAVVAHDSLPALYCDPTQIACVIAGLIENSIKFRGEARPEIHIGASPQKSTWTFSVRDNGIGIDPRFGARIFAPFKRIHQDTYPGPGIGLAIAKCVIERHGGQIWVESSLGQGSTFYFTLPKTDSKRSRGRLARSSPDA